MPVDIISVQNKTVQNYTFKGYAMLFLSVLRLRYNFEKILFWKIFIPESHYSKKVYLKSCYSEKFLS